MTLRKGGRAFVDTNVFVYAFDAGSPDKRAVALELLEGLDPVVSPQVMGEFFAVVTRKLTPPVSTSVAAEFVAKMALCQTVPVTADLVKTAIGTLQAHQLSYWDALIVEAAVAGRCERLLTEDLAAGSTIRGVTIENPFART
ncbi:MAG: PIN domain-containing protein [Micrococcales bacterium]|nr:PIN domain-containing protein [Micrococcales bacterium]